MAVLATAVGVAARGWEARRLRAVVRVSAVAVAFTAA